MAYPDPKIPQRSAGEITLPNGVTVWVKTLNQSQKDEVHEKASNYARVMTKPFRKGGEYHRDLWAEYREMEPEEQAEYLAYRKLAAGEITQEIQRKFEYPNPPEKAENEDDIRFMERKDRWEADCEAIDKKREEELERRVEAEKEAFLKLASRVRVQKCVDAFILQKYIQYYVKRAEFETLLLATRHPEDHSDFYFRNVQEVIDLDDSVMNALSAYYDSLDSVKPEEIPT